MSELPPDHPEEMLESIRLEFIKSAKTIVVLDDDPTGTQTCYDVPVLTSWHTALIVEELKKGPSVLFVLTNSRSLGEAEALQLTLEVGGNVRDAAVQSGREIVVVSRSDSTLRGHFPAEVEALAIALDMKNAVRVLVPAFIEGGRYTIEDVHYLVENDELVPVSDTPFARDVVFGYKHADLKKWVEEKSNGKIRSSDVISISLSEIRIGGPAVVSQKLKTCKPGATCIVNAASYRDLEVFIMGVLMAEKSGQKFLYRTSATFVPLRAGLVSGKTFVPDKVDTDSPHGSLVLVGSFVPKTSSQLTWLQTLGVFRSIEVSVVEILKAENVSSTLDIILRQTNEWLAAGEHVVIYTSRKLEAGYDSASSLKINASVSEFLVRIMKGISVRPRFIIAKGGITSSDLASKGLSAEKAMVLGAVIPGVPVWRMDIKSKFPEILYVVFPGNVGDEKALAEVYKRLNA